MLQQSPTTRISAMNGVLRAIEKAGTAQEVIANDDVFSCDRQQIQQIIDGPIYSKSFGRYLLLRVEHHLMDRSQPFAASNRISVEHVLPQRPKEGSKWLDDFTPEQRVLWTDRLANLVLISRIKNAELSNREFSAKKERYFKASASVFPNVIGTMLNSPQWTPAVLDERQKKLTDLLMDNFK